MHKNWLPWNSNKRPFFVWFQTAEGLSFFLSCLFKHWNRPPSPPFIFLFVFTLNVKFPQAVLGISLFFSTFFFLRENV